MLEALECAEWALSVFRSANVVLSREKPGKLKLDYFLIFSETLGVNKPETV